MKVRVKQLVLVLSLALCGAANAGPLTGMDVPGSLLVTRAGAEWAWVAPCAPEAPSCGSVPLIMHHGFRLAEEADLLAAFTGLADIDVAFASGTICASAYFNSGWDHCDGAVTNDVWNSPAAWGGPYDQQSFNETLVLRDGNGVPEPSAIALAGLALFGLGLSRRKVRV